MSFLDRFRAPVPEWAELIVRDRRTWAEFRKLVIAAARELDPNSKLDEEEGVVHATVRGRELELGLSNLARECARGDARDAVAEWRRKVFETADVGYEATAITWEAAAPRLRVQLQSSSRVDGREKFALELANDLYLALVLDGEQTITDISDDFAGLAGIASDAMFERAIANLDAQEVRIERDGTPIVLFESDNGYASTVVYLGMDREVASAKHGALVMFPTKYSSSVLPVHDSISTHSVRTLVENACIQFALNEGAITPNLYWWLDGVVTRVPVIAPDGVIDIALPPELCALVDLPN